MNEAELRRGMGYVIQHAGLFPHRTVLDNIGTVPRLLGWDKSEDPRRGRTELLERVGLAPELGERYPAQLSGGQQQRVGVARALAADPPVMLMDEPFSAVDPVVREQLQDEFLRLQAELGKTIVFVTHDIDEAIKLGDQVAVLRVGGRLAQVAEPAYLLAHPADDFVADFVGRDRGYRALRLPGGAAAAAALGAHRRCSASAPTARMPRWLLVVDDDRHPLGWVEPKRIGDRAGRPRPTCTVAAPWPANTALCVGRSTRPCRRRAAAASSSTTRGRCAAPCWPHEVLTAIEHTERPERDESDPVHGGAAARERRRGRARDLARRQLATRCSTLAVAQPLPRRHPARHRARRRRCRWAGSRAAGRAPTRRSSRRPGCSTRSRRWRSSSSCRSSSAPRSSTRSTSSSR